MQASNFDKDPTPPMSPLPPSQLPRKRNRSLAEEVMADLSGKIRGGTYKPGDKLPTEPEIMAEQGVSRTVVREALSRLQASGQVETRHGIGTFVLEPPSPAFPAFDFQTAASLAEVLAVMEFRMSIETEAAGLAAQRRLDEHLAAMRQALADFRRQVEQGEKAVDADFQFHLQIALATRNRYFEDFFRQLGTATIPRNRLDTARLAARSGSDYLLRANVEHERIYDAIERGDPDSARKHMHRHLSGSQERLRRAYQAHQNEK